jgi:membrane protein
MTIADRILKIRFIRKLIVLAKRLSFPGFEGVPIYNVILQFIKAIDEGVLSQRAASISFSFFMALFPGLLVLFTLIPFVPIDNFQHEIMVLIERVLPDATDDSVMQVISDIIIRPHANVLSLGFLLALIFSTNGFKSIIVAFNSSVHIHEDRGFFSLQWTSLVIVFVFTITSFVTILASIINQHFLDFLVEYDFMTQGTIYYIIKFANWIIMVAMILFMVSFLFYYGPKTKTKFKLISTGSSVSTVVIIIVMLLFNVYINNFSKYNVLYGSIGTLLIVLLWIYINAFILLLGFEINASIASAKSDADNYLPKNTQESP